jgi:hypothetical protein
MLPAAAVIDFDVVAGYVIVALGRTEIVPQVTAETFCPTANWKSIA